MVSLFSKVSVLVLAATVSANATSDCTTSTDAAPSVATDVVASASSLISTASIFRGKNSCRCIPGDRCWPSDLIWRIFNVTVGGKLIKTEPVAVSCYPGPDQNPAQCAYVDSNWTDATFQADNVVGLSYPTNITCPSVNVTAGETPTGSCTLGVCPSYAVDATNSLQVSLAVAFAKLFNIRLVVKNTGHDLLGRSEGHGGLEVWMRHLRNGITYEPTFQSSTKCSQSGWGGCAIKIAGAYIWGDVYAVAKANNVVVVGGGTPSVGAIGGWMQGGGHGPPSRQFGLGADQVLELDVVLASGALVTANACQNGDLFFALRGGGGGTYGIVVSSTIKAYPMVSVAVQHLAIGALSSDTSGLLDVVAILYSDYPDLDDAGYAGYGQWGINSPSPFFATFTAGYLHGFYMFNKTVAEAQAAFNATRAKLAPYNMTSVFISETYASYPDYWTFYNTESGVEPPVGTPSALGSRLFDRASVTSSFSALRSMIGTVSGTPDQYTINNFELVSGGQVFQDRSDPNSGVLPAWRTSYFSNIVARGFPIGTPESVAASIHQDITYVKTAAMKSLAPNTGSYMNEADRLDPDWKIDFYGSNYDKLLSIKQKYDPSSVFYCPTCVGSDAFGEDAAGGLCRV
ncbi:FAD-linked oxidoreductase hmp9 [Exophiala dermatitidis]